jgi:hypothetical protein
MLIITHQNHLVKWPEVHFPYIGSYDADRILLFHRLGTTARQPADDDTPALVDALASDKRYEACHRISCTHRPSSELQNRQGKARNQRDREEHAKKERRLRAVEGRVILGFYTPSDFSGI